MLPQKLAKIYLKIIQNKWIQEFLKFTKEVIEKLLENGKLNESEELPSWEELLKKLKQLERTRFAYWHDSSSLNNRSHLLVPLNVMCDTTCFVTDDEYYLRYKRQINVQTAVGKPHLFILVCCPSNYQQFLYSEETI